MDSATGRLPKGSITRNNSKALLIKFVSLF
jgi:hypothetical protein